MLKNDGMTNFAMKGANAQSGALTTVWNGKLPSGWSPMKKQGAIVLGSGGDCCASNTNLSEGTFYEGSIVSGYPSDSTDNAIQANIAAAGYGSNKPTNVAKGNDNLQKASPVKIRCVHANAAVVIEYALPGSRHVDINIFDQSGRRIAAIANGAFSAGRHKTLWNADRVPAGVYVCRVAIDGSEGLGGKIVIGK